MTDTNAPSLAGSIGRWFVPTSPGSRPANQRQVDDMKKDVKNLVSEFLSDYENRNLAAAQCSEERHNECMAAVAGLGSEQTGHAQEVLKYDMLVAARAAGLDLIN